MPSLVGSEMCIRDRLFVCALCVFSVAFWRVAAVFSVPRPFCSAFRASRCYLCAPFAFFSAAFCFIVQQSQKACYMSNSSTNGNDITKTCTGKIKAGDLVVQGLGQPLPPPLLLQAAVDRHHRQHPRHKKKHKELGITHEQQSAKPSATVPDTFKDL